VRADGSLERVRRGDPDFPGSVLALGCAGIVTALTLDLVPAFDVRQWVYEQVPTDDLDGILGAAYSSARSPRSPGPSSSRSGSSGWPPRANRTRRGAGRTGPTVRGT